MKVRVFVPNIYINWFLKNDIKAFIIKYSLDSCEGYIIHFTFTIN